ncbi:MAG: hypothetical protein HC842_04215 [Cytophagales bacterium]|nr:hypothetical protein [Cytophagales bacterium]
MTPCTGPTWRAQRRDSAFSFSTVCLGSQIDFEFNEADLRDFYMETMRLTLYQVKDRQGNVLDSVYFDMAIDNLGTATSPVAIERPVENFVITQSRSSAEFLLSDYEIDQFRAGLDSLVLQYHRKPSGPWTTIRSLGVAELKAYFQQTRSLYGQPKFPVLWNPAQTGLPDGTYQMRAVAFSRGFERYSNVVEGVVDLTSPLLRDLTWKDSLLYVDSQLELNFSEEIDLYELTQQGFTINQVVSFGGPAARGSAAVALSPIDPSYYQLHVFETNLVIDFTDYFFASYNGELIEIDIDHLQDLYGNAMSDDIHLGYTIVNGTTQDQGSPLPLRGANLRGRYAAGGVVELTWNGEQDHPMSHYEVERS